MKSQGESKRVEVRPLFLWAVFLTMAVSVPGLFFGSAWPRVVGLQVREPAPIRRAELPPQLQVAYRAERKAQRERVDCHAVNCLALTFDDGPNPETTPQILRELREAKLHATFFVIGSRVSGNEEILRQMHSDGNEVENHSWMHPNFTKLTAPDIQQQFQLTQDALVNAGLPAPTMFRPPYGAFNQTVIDNVPLDILLWNEDPQDWQSTNSAQVVQAVEASARPGGIVDLHDIYHATADALPQIITDLQAQGFHLVTVSELLGLEQPGHGVYYGYAN